jgi:hypothetical protein
MCRANPFWGTPRIHGELLKLGIETVETAVAKYMLSCRGPPSQAWKTFLDYHLKETIAGSLHDSNGDVQGSIRIDHPELGSATNPALQCQGASDGRLDRTLVA